MYALGVDLGTVFTAAATWRNGHAEISSLGSRAATIPSVVLLREDASILTGEAANRRALLEPSRVAREFKRRFGDSTPILLGSTPYSAESLVARLLKSVVVQVSAQQGAAPAAMCLCHPANWGPYKIDLLQQAVRMAELDVPVSFAVEPAAAAAYYARQQRLDPGALVAVYDLGGGTFDAAVLRKTYTGFEIIGRPEGIEHLGGADFDAAVFSHVRGVVGSEVDALDEGLPSTVAAVARLREECTSAKETLSSDTDTTIPVLLPNLATEVRITRAELEQMVRPLLYDTISALQRAIRTAGVTPQDLHSVLLIGGSSRMPLVAQLVGAELDRPVAVDAHPKHAVALGAAWVAGDQLTRRAAPVAGPASYPPPFPGADSGNGAHPAGGQDDDSPSAGVRTGITPTAVGVTAAGGGTAADQQQPAPARPGEPTDSGDSHRAGRPGSAAATGVAGALLGGAAASALSGAVAPPAPPSTPGGPPPGPASSGSMPPPAATPSPGGAVIYPGMASGPGAGPISPPGGTPPPGATPPPGWTAGAAHPFANGEPQQPRSLLAKPGMIAAAAAAAVILLVGLGAFLGAKSGLFGSGATQGPPSASAGAPAAGSAATAASKSPAAAVAPANNILYTCPTKADSAVWGCFKSVKSSGGKLLLDYTSNFSLSPVQDSKHHHFHIYQANPGPNGTTVPTDAIMQHVANPGSWFILYDGSTKVIDNNTERGGGKAGIDTKKYSLLCVRVAVGLHDLAKDKKGGYRTGNCAKITT